METALVPGVFVAHPDRPDWGLGQVQSSINGVVTVNFEHAGKQTINATIIKLQLVKTGAER